MQLNDVLAELKSLGSECIKKVVLNHGAKEPFWGVKIGVKKTMKSLCPNHARIFVSFININFYGYYSLSY